MYKCKICQKTIKLIKTHLKFTHNNMSVEDYFAEFGDKDKYDSYQESLRGERRANSPNCIEFYIAKGMSYTQATEAIEAHRSKLPFRNKKDFRPNQLLYWEKQGYSSDESDILVKEFQSRSKASYIKKCGKEEGLERYRNFCKSLSKRKSSEIESICKKHNISKEYAEIIFKQKRSDVSPRRKEYWRIHKGMSDKDSELAVVNWQARMSPRSEEYWISRNVENPEEKVSQYQDFSSIKSIMNRTNCSFEESIDIQNAAYNRFQEKYNNIKYNDIDFKDYSKIVRSLSNTNYCLYKHILDPKDLRSTKFHLDHIVSIVHCYMADLNVQIASSVQNLQILYYKDNLIKNSKSDMEISELIEKYYENKDKQ